MSFKRKMQNLRPSWKALVFLWREEYSFKVQSFAALAVVVVSYVLEVSKIEFAVLVLVMGAVLAIEALNTALEELCDHITLDQHPKIGKIKDLGSGAALLISIAAVVIGFIIFIPHLFST